MYNTNSAGNRSYSSESALIIFFAAVALLVHLLTNGRYGYFRDELYYIACGRHLALGYVDQSPLSILLLRLSEILLGDSLFAIRLLPALAGAATVALTGAIARELDGRGWAIALACAGSLCALFSLAVGNFFSMNAFEPLFWMGCVYLYVRIINGGSPTLWLWLGVLLGLSLENKHSTAFFAAGIFVALLLTPERRYFAGKWIWLGGLIALAIALPNILWQARHHWPTYELLSNIAHSNKNVALSPAQFIVQQVVFMNPGTLPLWLAGPFWLLGSRECSRYRAIGYHLSNHARRVHYLTWQKLLSRAGVSDALFRGRRGHRTHFRFSSQMAEAGFAQRDARNGRLICAIRGTDFAARQTCRIHASHSLPTAMHRDIAYGGAAAGFCRPVWLGTNGWLGGTRLS